jgi:hypothetical protein
MARRILLAHRLAALALAVDLPPGFAPMPDTPPTLPLRKKPPKDRTKEKLARKQRRKASV